MKKLVSVFLLCLFVVSGAFAQEVQKTKMIDLPLCAGGILSFLDWTIGHEVTFMTEYFDNTGAMFATSKEIEVVLWEGLDTPFYEAILMPSECNFGK